jgi:hypothetical protein
MLKLIALLALLSAIYPPLFQGKAKITFGQVWRDLKDRFTNRG